MVHNINDVTSIKEGIKKNMFELPRDGLLGKKFIAYKLGISIADV